MRAVVQRVARARVLIEGQVAGSIEHGLLVLLGIATADTVTEAEWLADKILNLRIFANEAGKFDQSLLDLRAELLVVSQFTLLADTRKGRRPAFTDAAAPELAVPLYQSFLSRAAAAGVRVASGRFGANMQVELINDGPVTIILETPPR
ncbi:MAG TPA: D-aminoacyl-tRNA deacylase [Terriglobales bacterium]|nr:D-aminoacyl-tRNA deacylase [Terriglobales bacterium]